MVRFGGGVASRANKQDEHDFGHVRCDFSFTESDAAAQRREGRGSMSCFRGSEPITAEKRCYGVGTKVKGTE